MSRDKLKLFVTLLLAIIICSFGLSKNFVADASDEDPLLKEIANYKKWTKTNPTLNIIFDSSEFG